MLTDPDAVLKRVNGAMDEAEPIHRWYRSQWQEAYSLHRNHRRLKNYLQQEPDRDTRQREIEDAWKSELCIPLIFTAIETIVPRLLSNNPTMTVKPRSKDAIEHTRRIKEWLEQTQIDIDYDLKLEPTARRGLKYGLGVQKTYWQRKTRKRLDIEPRRIRGDKVVASEVVLYEGPQVESVDIWDFFWDPEASSVETAKWLIHRTWRSMAYVKKQIESGKWMPMDLDEVQRASKTDTLDTTQTERLAAQGAPTNNSRQSRVEVLEMHTGDCVYTTLNRAKVAQMDVTPFWHRQLPFQIFRPTVQEGEFVGISEIEPIKHLQYELNTMRGQRRDNANFILDRVFAYQEGMVEEHLWKRGPGARIPVIGDPNEVISALPAPDLPASSYREEDAIMANFDRATGINDATTGGSAGAADTATGVQLVQDAANVRIARKTRNLMAEVVRPAARQFYELGRQYVAKEKDIRVDDPAAESGYRFERVDPKIFKAEVDLTPDASSTEPENKVQKRNDSLTVYNQLNQNPVVDQRALVTYLLREHDISDSENLLLSEEQIAEQNQPPGPDPGALAQSVAEMLNEIGVPEDRIMTFMEEVLAQAEQASPQPTDQPAPNNGAELVPA